MTEDAAVSAVLAQAAAAEAVVRMAISCAHPITGEEHDAVEAADAALDALLARVAELDDRNRWRWPAEREARLRAEAEAERLKKAGDALSQAIDQMADPTDPAHKRRLIKSERVRNAQELWRLVGGDGT